jgi:spore coat polysaccharide biosynthesis predicted glycosyltransferase SpsG|tara:strand:+ start:276 stop:737 length:462 start_codon:yes stop_codon:yes gene_type:complete
MTKKEKILFSYIANIIYDERPSDVFIETSQDISKLLKRIEKLNIETLSIAPSIENITSESFDLFIVLDDVKVTEANIGTIKNLISQKIVIFTDFENDGKTDKTMIKLGLQTELRDKTNELKCFSYNLKTYNNKRDWNNPKGWANPENFDKFRW